MGCSSRFIGPAKVSLASNPEPTCRHSWVSERSFQIKIQPRQNAIAATAKDLNVKVHSSFKVRLSRDQNIIIILSELTRYAHELESLLREKSTLFILSCRIESRSEIGSLLMVLEQILRGALASNLYQSGHLVPIGLGLASSQIEVILDVAHKQRNSACVLLSANQIRSQLRVMLRVIEACLQPNAKSEELKLSCFERKSEARSQSFGTPEKNCARMPGVSSE